MFGQTRRKRRKGNGKGSREREGREEKKGAAAGMGMRKEGLQTLEKTCYIRGRKQQNEFKKILKKRNVTQHICLNVAVSRGD